MYVGVQYSGHLGLLDRADLTLGVHDKYTDILLTTQTVDGGRSSVTTGCANDCQVFPVPAISLALVSPSEEVLKEVAEKLQGDILESEGGPVEKLKEVEVLLLVEGCDRDNVVGAESAVALLDDLFQVGFRDLVSRNVKGEDFEGEVLEGQIPPSGLPVGRQGRNLFGDEQAAVVGETLQDDILKGELASFSA